MTKKKKTLLWKFINNKKIYGKNFQFGMKMKNSWKTCYVYQQKDDDKEPQEPAVSIKKNENLAWKSCFLFVELTISRELES